MLWHAYPKHESIIETYDVGELTVEVLDHPSLRSSIDLAVVAFSLLVFHKNEIIAVFQIEQEDLRSLSERLGCSIRELQDEYRTKGTLSDPRVYVYTKERRNDEGPYEEELTFFSAREFLLELMCDTFDLLFDPVLRG
ncbi:MAG: hypothetical protein GX313_02995, partial [Spirochaetales bacterium]|nr:hypothetical protein [Spirochaetales bacterium]